MNGPLDTATHDTASLGWVDAVTAAVTAALLVVTFAPWGRSGERTRNSYELVDVVGPAGVVSAARAELAQFWYCVPVLCALVFVCGFWVARRTAGALVAIVGVSVVTFAYLVDRSALVATTGCHTALVVGTAAALWGVVLLVRPRRIGKAPR